MPNNNIIPVSVVIPCYRCADTIQRAVSSVAAQTALPADLWLIEDASGDDGVTLSRLYEMQKLYGNLINIYIFPLPVNSGPAIARNVGWDRATQPYVAFLDADDSWHPQKLEIQYNWMQEHPDAALTGHPCLVKAKEANDTAVPDNWQTRPVKLNNLLFSNIISTPSVMLKKKLPYRFASNKRYVEDYMLWLHILAGNHKIYFLDLPLAYLYKERYGQKGLSADLWKMEKGELDVYLRLRQEGLIATPTQLVLSGYSLLKYIRRFIKTGLSGSR